MFNKSRSNLSANYELDYSLISICVKNAFRKFIKMISYQKDNT